MKHKPGSPPLWFVIAIFAGMAAVVTLVAWAFSHDWEGPLVPVENVAAEP